MQGVFLIRMYVQYSTCNIICLCGQIGGLNLQPMQVYGRMINLQNSLRRYWESIAVGDYKKKPRYYESLCKVFGTDYNEAAIQGDEYINVSTEQQHAFIQYCTCLSGRLQDQCYCKTIPYTYGYRISNACYFIYV